LKNYKRRMKTNHRMKLLISGQDSGGYGGAEIFLYQLSKGLKKKGVEVEFVVVAQSEFDKFLRRRGLKAKSVPFRMDILGWWKGLVKFFFLLPAAFALNYQILREFKNNGGELVIIPGFSDKLILTPLASLLGLSVVWIELPPLKTLFKRNFYLPKILYRLVSGLPAKVVPCSENTKKSLIEDARIDRAKIKVIPCGIEILPPKKIALIRKRRKKIRERLGIDKKFVVGVVSRIDEKEKGHDTLLKAAALLKNKHQDLFFLLVGGGNKRGVLSLIDELGLEKEVKLLGFRKDIFEIISAFDVFVFPTRWHLEGFGLVPLEAMMMKVPVVASNFGPVPEVVGNAAYLVKPIPKEVADGIEKIMEDKELARKLIIKGQKRARRFEIGKMAEIWINEIRGLERRSG